MQKQAVTIGFGGTFATPEPMTTAGLSNITAPELKRNLTVLRGRDTIPMDSGVLVSTAGWSLKPVYIDSLPPASSMNKADKCLLEAKLAIDKANIWHRKVGFVLLAYAVLAVPIGIIGTYFLFQAAVGLGFLAALLSAFLIAILWSLVFAGIGIIAEIPSTLEKHAEQRIRKAVKKAPEDRKVEYFVRAVLMLRYRHSPRWILRQLRRAENMVRDQRDLEWTRKLQVFKEQLPDKVKGERLKSMLFVALLLLGFLVMLASA